MHIFAQIATLLCNRYFEITSNYANQLGHISLHRFHGAQATATPELSARPIVAVVNPKLTNFIEAIIWAVFTNGLQRGRHLGNKFL